MGAWDLPEVAADPYVGLEEPDYAKFENVSVSLRTQLYSFSPLYHSASLNSSDPKSRVITAVSDV